MAKGNLFLGTAARSVGDVVMYRREGAQVSRVRVRKIANPKTDAQCLQRAFMSACVKFYQPLANVLDRSWQGKSRAKSYAAFLKANAPKVRAAGYYLPKGTGFFPLPLQVSEGTIQPLSYEVIDEADKLFLSSIDAQTTSPTTIGALSTLFINAGYKTGDIVTLIFSHNDEAIVHDLAVAQFELDATSAATVASVMPSWITVSVDASLKCIGFEPTSGLQFAFAAIVARNVDGVWQRSKQTMAVKQNELANITSDAAKTACIESYKGAAASDNPLVYLDGDELTD